MACIELEKGWEEVYHFPAFSHFKMEVKERFGQRTLQQIW